MEEPVTQNPMVLKCSLAVHLSSTAGNKQLEHQHPASSRPSLLLSKPPMRNRAEMNRFALFLFCSLVSLGSLAPTATTEESRSTPEQRQKRFTTRIKPLASVIASQASILFENYNACSPITPRTESWLTADSKVENLVKEIPECPVFDADCCFFHIFYNLLQYLKSDVELICGTNLVQFFDANISQLQATLNERAALYTCQNKDLAQMDRQVQEMKTVKKMMFIWQALQKYEQLMQNTTKMNL